MSNAGMPPGELASLLDVGPATVRQWRRGEALPHALVLRRLSLMLRQRGAEHASIDYLLATDVDLPTLEFELERGQ